MVKGTERIVIRFTPSEREEIKAAVEGMPDDVGQGTATVLRRIIMQWARGRNGAQKAALLRRAVE